MPISQPSVSVVIPVYNAAPYVGRCIDSLLTQTFSDFELIAVDDGSADGSLEILEDYARRDPRVSVFSPGHGGVSAARNFGIEAAAGKWIAFVDADDYLDPDYLECLVPEDDEVELSLCGLTQNYIAEGRVLKTTAFDPNLRPEFKTCQRLTLNDLLEKINTYTLHSVYCKLYLRSKIEEYGLRFEVGMDYGEDNLFVVRYVGHVSHAVISDSYGYHYVRSQNSESLSASPSARRWFDSALLCLSESMKFCADCSYVAKNKIERHFVDILLQVLALDRESPSLTAGERRQIYEAIIMQSSREVRREKLPFFFGFCGHFGAWGLYERLFKIIYQ